MEQWMPWRSLICTKDALQLKEPPCKHCQHWKPEQKYPEFESVRLCQAETQFRDFSCFREKQPC